MKSYKALKENLRGSFAMMDEGWEKDLDKLVAKNKILVVRGLKNGKNMHEGPALKSMDKTIQTMFVKFKCDTVEILNNKGKVVLTILKKDYLKRNVQESTSIEVPNRGLPQMVDGGINMFAIENKNVLDKMNAALSYINASPTSDPRTRIVDIKKTISHAGLDFDHSLFEADEENPVIEIPIMQHGGRMGMTPEEGWVNDDGISHRTGGVKYGIKLETSKGQGGLWSIDATVGPLSEEGGE